MSEVIRDCSFFHTWETKEKLEKSFVDWLDPIDWNFWGTFEFDRTKPVRDPVRAKKYFVEYIKKQFDFPDSLWCSYFMAVENFKNTFNLHIHFMLAGLCLGMSEKNAGKVIGAPWWKKHEGYCFLEKYDPLIGAAGYLSKYVMKEMCDWDIRLKNEHRKDYLLFKH